MDNQEQVISSPPLSPVKKGPLPSWLYELRSQVWALLENLFDVRGRCKHACHVTNLTSLHLSFEIAGVHPLDEVRCLRRPTCTPSWLAFAKVVFAAEAFRVDWLVVGRVYMDSRL